MSFHARLGDWIARPSGSGWLVGRLRGERVTRRRYYRDGRTALTALLRGFEREKGVQVPQETIEALRANAEVWGEQLSLSGFESEEAAGRRALEAMEANELRAHYLDVIRSEMRRRAEAGFHCTPDDARACFEAMDPPGPELLSRNFLGCVFRGPEWEACGTYKSATPGSHGNRLNLYRLRRD